MEILRKIFPFSFKQKKDIGELLLYILIHLGVGALVTMLVAIPGVGSVIGILSGIADLYLTAGIILSILNYCKVL